MADTKYISKVLTDKEKLVAQFGYHWTRYISPKYIWVQGLCLLFACVVGSILSLASTLPSGGVWLWSFIAWLCVEWFAWIAITSDVRIVTNKRVILKEGFLSRKTSEMKLSAIEAIEFDQSFLERLLGVGCLNITGRGGGSVIKFHHVSKPINTKHMIENIDWNENEGYG